MPKPKYLLLLICASLSLGSTALAEQNENMRAAISINAIGNSIISNNLIGTNLHVGYERDIDTDRKKNHLYQLKPSTRMTLNRQLIARCREASIHMLRFPGGGTSDAYRWREGVGPMEKRPIGKDEYGWDMKHFLGTLEFGEVADALGAEMMITANYKTGTAQEAANWVEYCNGGAGGPQPGWTDTTFPASASAPAGYFAWLRALHGRVKPLNVKFWEIGNEILFHKDTSYLDRAAEYSRLMKAADPTIQVGLNVESFLYMSKNNIEYASIPRGIFDFITIHYYSTLKTRRPLTIFYNDDESFRDITVSNAGTYEIRVTAKGSRALEWPRMPLYVNGALVREFKVDSPSLETYRATVELKQGHNTLVIAFVNDMHIPGMADSNLHVKSVKLVGPDRNVTEVWNTREYEYAWLFANNKLIEEHVELIKRTFPDLPLMITEGNAGYGINEGNINRQETRKLKAGLWLAGLLNALIRKDVPVFTHWKLTDAYMGFNMVAPDGHVTPSYHVFKMYSKHINQRSVELAISSPTFDAPLLETTAFGKATTANPFVDAVASYDEQNRMLIMTLLNRHSTNTIHTELQLGTLRINGGKYRQEVLNAADGKGLEADNEQNPNNVAVRTSMIALNDPNIVLALEPHSLTAIYLPAEY